MKNIKKKNIWICIFVIVLSFIKYTPVAANTIQDGVYSVPVSLWNATQEQASMGNAALYQEGKLIVENGQAKLRLKFTSLNFSGMTGYMMYIKTLEDITFNTYTYPESYTCVDSEVISTYAIEDAYNSASSPDANCADKKYPKVAEIEVDGNTQMVWAEVYVPIMGSLGFGNQICRIKIDYSAIEPMNEAKLATWVEYETSDNDIDSGNDETSDNDADNGNDETDDNDNSNNEDNETLTVNKDGLKTQITLATEAVGKTSVYTEASINKLSVVLAEAQKVYNNANATQAAVDMQVIELKNAIATLVKKSEESLDKNNLADGKYTVTVDLWHATADKESMGNASINHESLVTVSSGVYTMEISTHPMTVGTITACLQTLQIKQTDGNYVYADITAKNNPDSQPSVFQFTLPNKDEYIDVKIDPKVEIMGTEPLNARLKISWDTLKQVESDTVIVENNETTTSGLESPAVSIKDSATGIKLSAEANVLPEGVKMKVKELTSGSTYTTAYTLISAVGTNMKMYKITLYNSSSSDIQPSGMVQISIPIPDDYTQSNVLAYRVADSAKTLMSGSISSDMYVFSTNKIAVFSIVEKTTITTTTTTSKTALSTKKTTTTPTVSKTVTSSGNSTDINSETSQQPIIIINNLNDEKSEQKQGIFENVSPTMMIFGGAIIASLLLTIIMIVCITKMFKLIKRG